MWLVHIKQLEKLGRETEAVLDYHDVESSRLLKDLAGMYKGLHILTYQLALNAETARGKTHL